MKSQDVRKQGALVRTAQEVLKKKDVVQTVPNNNEETPMVSVTSMFF